MRRLLLLAALLLIPASALAVVQPPEEWFDSPQKYLKWQQISPLLLDVEFGKQDPYHPQPSESLGFIQQHLGKSREEAAQDEGVDPDSIDILRHDLNLDGKIDHLDVLELGYEAMPSRKTPSIAPPTGTNKWIVIRTDFSNKAAIYGTYDVDYFKDKLFNEGVDPPSCNDYFQETSYGQLEITGDVSGGGGGGDGWYRADNTKEWYHASFGRARVLIREMVQDADPFVDFSDFDVDGDGYVDTLVLFYAGPVWFGGGLHPHRSSGLNISVDGVIVDSYFLTGYHTNDSWAMTITVHEYGHILGLPDLYDVNGGSAGMGKWSLMAYSYDNGQKPPSPDPWCKIQLGWLEPKVITDNVTGYELDYYQSNQEVLKVWTNGQQEDQYFLVANYRKQGTDANRPGQGLLILHIDDTRAGGNGDNADENRKHVDTESARGYWNPNSSTPKDPLDDNADRGHAKDLWYEGNDGYSGYAESYSGIFDVDSNPHSHDYPSPGDNTYVRISNISASADTMTLDIEVETGTAPTCTIDSPAGGASVSGGVTVDVTATAAAGRSIDHVEFYFNGAYFGSDDSEPYSMIIDSRSIYDGDRVIKAIAVDDQGEIDTDTVSVTVSNSAVAIPYGDGFEGGIGAWAAYDWGGDRRWEEKDTAYAGSKSAGIGHVSNGYDYNEHDALVSIRFDLSGATHPIARFRHRYRVAGGENTCKVFVTSDGGGSFDLLATYAGSHLAWGIGAVDLLDYAGQEVHLLFRLDSSSLNRMSGEAGWWVDEFEVKELSAPPSIDSITPGDGSTLTGVETITVEASDDEGVLSVEFYIDDDDLIHTDYSEPFTIDWNSDWVFNGSHGFTATAYDGDLQSGSMTVGWTADNAGQGMPWAEGFDSDPGNAWRIIDNNGAGEWQWLSGAGYSGGGMRLSIPGFNYHDNLDNDWLISPTLDFSGAAKPAMGFLHRFDIEDNYDYGRVYVTTDLVNWTQLLVFSRRNQFSWRADGALLDSYAGQVVKLAFFFESDGGLVRQGWWLDDVQAGEAPQITDVSPASVINGATITISGTGFGGGGASDFPSVMVSGYVASVDSWTDTEITATVPEDSNSGKVVVTRHGMVSDGFGILVILPPPVLTDVGQL
ncbi:M6 family metalloprotease domain-containing protein [bacterium]|nr:M6 family metalloprotease domain-containing protein [bacterium]